MKKKKSKKNNKSFQKFPLNLFKYIYIGIKSMFFSFPLFLISKITKKEKKSSNIIILISLTTYLICIFILTQWYVQNERTKKFNNYVIDQNTISIEEFNNEYTDITNPIINNQTSLTENNKNNTNSININLNYYIKKNKDTVGWLKINNTNINYPIVQYKDNDYYLNHDFYKKKTSIGWIFADYRNNLETLNTNTIIYGHNLINKTMFGNLTDFLKEKWLNKKEMPNINLSTTKYNSTWQIFSIYKTNPTTDYLQTQFNSVENYKNFLKTIKNKSVKNFNISVEPTDKIITLSTCDDTGKYRVAIHAKLIKLENKNS